jgi:hypothetical protein
MTGPSRARGPSRHEIPRIDEAALRAARLADPLLAAARERGLARWERYLAPIPEALRDGDLRDLRAAARSSRAAFGPKDSIADALPADLWIPFRDAIDDLVRRIARFDVAGEG